MRRALFVAAALLATACTFDPTIPAGRISCEMDSDCTSGFRCVRLEPLASMGVCCREEQCRDIPPDGGGGSGGGAEVGAGGTGGGGGSKDGGTGGGGGSKDGGGGGAIDAPVVPGTDAGTRADAGPADTGLPPGKCRTSADCSGVTPVCDASGACRACADGECTAPTSRCVTSGAARGACVECIDSRDCANDPARPICSNNACGPCTQGAECSLKSTSTPACAGGRCVQCSVDGDCMGTSPRCNTTSHLCQSCTKNADCSGNTPLCDTTKGMCRACATSPECTTAMLLPLCSTSGTTAGACVQCTSNAQCSGTTPICNLSTGRCRACMGTDCATGFPGKTFCGSSGACVQCRAAADCSISTPVCTASNTCGPCSQDAQCAAPRPATPYCKPGGGPCVACTASTQCTASTAPICDATTFACRGCGSNTECSSRNGSLGNNLLRCGAGGVCVQCVGNADCPSSAPTCASNSCGPCASDAGCAGRSFTHCLSGGCVQCLANGDCANGQVCLGNHTCCTPNPNACDGIICGTVSDGCRNITCDNCLNDKHCDPKCSLCLTDTQSCP
jgi:Cys-rich repeat protein